METGNLTLEDQALRLQLLDALNLKLKSQLHKKPDLVTVTMDVLALEEQQPL